VGMKRRRLRKWAKWTCTLAAGAAVALAVFSRFARCWDSFYTRGGNDLWTVVLGAGQLVVQRTDVGLYGMGQPSTGWHMEWAPEWRWGYSGEVLPYDPSWDWHGGILLIGTTGERAFGLSILYPVLLASIPAALLWYRDRRRFGPGMCTNCGYNRHGLAPDAKCPECGTVPAPAAK
jgi:hypothetical protein